MSPITTTPGEVRPIPTPRARGDGVPVPLGGGRSRHHPPIDPEECRVPDCPICAWRKAGLLNHPSDGPRRRR
jgi:hypothetical protein